MAFYTIGNDLNCGTVIDAADESHIVDDLSIIPLEKDSFAICELCGRVGRRDYFYSKNNRFCSLRCHRRRRLHCNWTFKVMEGTEHMAGLIPLEPLPQLQHWQAALNDLQAGPIKQSAALVANSYEWKDELFGCDFLAAPVSLFKHAPLHEMWDSTFEGMKVEVKNTDCGNNSEKLSDYFWVATVLKVKGYMGLLRYEGFGSDDSKDFWVNLCCSEVHPVGWCATRGKPLIPPRSIEDKYTDWKKFLVKQLTGARTLPANFYSKLNDSLLSRFSIGSIMEVVDKNRISQVKVASVCEIVGKRLHVKYYDSSPEDNGFWCHEDSPLIHPIGWAFRVGHPLDAPQTYCQRVAAGRYIPNDTTPDMFYKYPTNEPPLFSEGMKLEAIDPLNLSAVCAATVMQILNEGYMMIRIDCYPADASGADWFCYHQRSPCIFPVGFALANNISLVPPSGFTAEEFGWEQYLSMTGSRAASRSLFAARGHVVSHGFVAGMRLECADLMDPRLVCVATIARVVADLLKVHFDGWGAEYDQWLWAHSTDMYPVGWCRAVGHRLEGPLQPPPRQVRKLLAKPARRKRRQHQVAKPVTQPPNTTEESSQNSDLADTKSLSPPTSVSEVSADTEPRTDREDISSKMEVDTDSKNSHEPVEERLPEVVQDFTNKMMHSIKAALEIQNEKFNNTLDGLRQDFNDFRNQLVDIKATIKKLSGEQIALKNYISSIKSSNENNNAQIASLTKDTIELRSTVAGLTEELRAREQQGRINNLEITGIPTTKNENLMNIVQNIANKIGFSLCPTDIDYIHRVRRFGSKTANDANINNSLQGSSSIPNIILRFTQRKRKSDMLAAVRARRGLTTVDAGLDGPSKPIFINDHLTPQNKLVYRQVRLMAKDKNYSFVWLSDGKILVRKNELSKVILISCESDLVKIK